MRTGECWRHFTEPCEPNAGIAMLTEGDITYPWQPTTHRRNYTFFWDFSDSSLTLSRPKHGFESCWGRQSAQGEIPGHRQQIPVSSQGRNPGVETR